MFSYFKEVPSFVLDATGTARAFTKSDPERAIKQVIEPTAKDHVPSKLVTYTRGIARNHDRARGRA